MPIVTMQSKFEGISIEYAEDESPFFAVGVNEALAMISSKELGQKLLKLIADARPQGGTWGATVPPNTRVLIRPAKNRNYIQVGFKSVFIVKDGEPDKKSIEVVPGGPNWPYAPGPKPPGGAPETRDFYYKGDGSCNKGNDASCAADKRGTCCELSFDSTQIMTSKGVSTSPFIVLAHELIHSYHNLYGIVKGDGLEEERCTTGIAPYHDDEFTENAFRKAFGLPLRDSY